MTTTKNKSISYEDWKNQLQWINPFDWQIKKFADKLKDIVCLLIGCTREQLEDSEFKNKELGEEWRVHYNWHYKLKQNSNLLGIAGSLYFTRQEADNEMSSVTFNELEHGTYILTTRLFLQLLGTHCERLVWFSVNIHHLPKILALNC